MSLFGVELNAGWARAVSGPAAGPVCPITLEPPHAELALAVSLEERLPVVGQAGLRLCRRAPHLALRGFLPRLGQKPAPGDPLGPSEALGLVLQRLQPIFKGSEGLVLTVPAYLNAAQIRLLSRQADAAGLPLRDTVSAPLAQGLGAHAESKPAGAVLLLDCDEYALTVAVSAVSAGEPCLLGANYFPALGLRIWKERLLNALADRCILQSRLDPRDSAIAEQTLYEQLGGVLEACAQGRLVNVGIQAANWYQNVALQPEQTLAACAGLVRRTLTACATFLRGLSGALPTRAWLTAAVGLLPGLAGALKDELRKWATPASADFGAGLLDEITVQVLSPDALAEAAHGRASRLHSGEPSAAR